MNHPVTTLNGPIQSLGPLFDPPPPPVRMTYQADLDALGAQLKAYEADRHPGWARGERKTALLGLVEGLWETMPPHLKESRDFRLHDLVEGLLSAQADLRNPHLPDAQRTDQVRANDRLAHNITGRVQAARVTLVPQRMGYPPDRRMKMIEESGARIAFMRRFVDAFRHDNATSEGRAVLAHWPQLTEVAHQATRMLAMFDLTEEIGKTFKDKPHRGDEAWPREQQAQIRYRMQMAHREYAPLHPAHALPVLNEALAEVAIADTPRTLEESYRVLRLAACDFARFVDRDIRTAYKQDRAEHRAAPQPEPTTPSKLLSVTYEARWAKAAKLIYEKLDSAFKTLSDPCVAPAGEMTVLGKHTAALATPQGPATGHAKA